MIVSRVFDFSHSRQSFGLFGFITRGFAVRLGFVPFNSHLIDRFSLPHSIISSAMTSSQTQVWLFTSLSYTPWIGAGPLIPLKYIFAFFLL